MKKIQYLIFAILLFPFFGLNLSGDESSKLCFYAYESSVEDSNYNKECMPCTPSQNDAGTIAFTKYWKIVYVPNQSYLGRLVISSQRHFGSYEEMNDEEAIEYRNILKVLLPALKKVFSATHFNVAYLMNMAFNSEKAEPAFKDGKPNPHFHWHIIPRYDGPREFLNEKFEDPDFGDSFNMKRRKILLGEFRKQTIQLIRKEIIIQYLPLSSSSS